MEPLERDEVGLVLVVDDEPALLRGCVRALEQAGIPAEGAEDGARALQLVQVRSYDVIVSDISMPGLDGLGVLRAVRRQDVDVPVVLMTGQPAVDSAVKAVEYGALRYLVKPFEIELFVETVRQAKTLHRVARLRRQAARLVEPDAKQIGDRMALEASFERVLSSLWMAYQPIVSWSGRGLHAFEALLRSGEPALPHPGAILEAAERLGRVHDLGRAVRDRVASLVAGAPAQIFVNLHSHDLLDETLYAAASPLSKVASRVVLEITERAALDEVPDARERIGRLRQLGFRVAVDDLGAGYAGLTSFALLEPEVVKFDMALVRGLAGSPKRQKLIGSMAALFGEMGVTVVAEGVETAAERDALVAAGCDLFQGYLFARPGEGFPMPRF
ncbi:MAG: EAL domain-containing protein [Myxococcales bacterium]